MRASAKLLPVTNVTKLFLISILFLIVTTCVRAGDPVVSGAGAGDSVVVPAMVTFGAVPFDTCVRRTDTVAASLANSGAVVINLSLRHGSAYQLIGSTVDTLDGRLRSLFPFTLQFCPTRDTTCPADTLVVWYRVTADSLDTGRVQLVPITGCGTQNTPSLTAIPSRLDFGRPRPDSCVTRQVTILGTPGARVTARLLLQGNAATSFTIVSPSTSPVVIDSSLVVTIRYCPQPGDASGADATLRLSNDTTGTTTPLVDVPLQGITDALRIPQSIDFGTVPVGACVDTTIVVRNFSRRGLTLRSYVADTTIGRFTTLGNGIAQVPMGDSVPFTVRFCPDSIGLRTGVWTIDSLPTGAAATLSLSGRGGAALLSISPEPLIFPTVNPPVTICSDDTVRIVNTGSAPFVIDSLLVVPLDFSVVSPSNLPATVRPGETLHVALRFCPNRVGLVTGSLRIGVAGNPARTVTLIGQTDTSTGGNGLLVPTRSSIDIGVLPLGQRITQVIVLKNLGSGTATLDSSTVSPSPPFTILGARGGGPIRPGDSITITIEFRPVDTGDVTGVWTGFTGISPNGLSVVLAARAVGRRIWFDTVSIRVGEEGSFSLHVAPPLTTRDSVANVRAVFSYDPRSIVPLSAASDVGDARLERVNDSTVALDVTANASGFIFGEVPGRVSFVGLTSGRPANVITIDSDSVVGIASLVTTAQGMILLEGCDIGRDPALSRRSRINSMRVTGGDELLIEYRAPLHSAVTLLLIDLSGRLVARIGLPEGDDSDHAVRISLSDVPSGSYVLNLLAGSDHSGSMIRIP